MPIGPIRLGTVTVPDLAAAVTAYEGLGLRVAERGALDHELARTYGAPAAAGAASATLTPGSGIGGAVRLVEAEVPAGYRPLRSYGWAALELCVGDLDGLAARLPDAFTVLGTPNALSLGAALRAMQVAGPGGEVLYLTEIRGPVPPFELPVGSGGVDGVYVAVLAARDLTASRAWLETAFAVRRCTDRRGAIGVLNRAFNLPPDAAHRLSSLQLAGRSVIEIDQYPPVAVPRPRRPGGLPPGVAVVSVEAETDPAVLRGPEGILLELVRPRSTVRAAPEPAVGPPPP